MDQLPTLTTRQSEVYNFIRVLIRSRGYGPTVREIGDKFGFKSPNGVMCHLRALEAKGYIRREANMSRAIQLVTEATHERTLPLAGRIAAGMLHEAIEQNDRVDFGSLFDTADRDLFVLEVSGDSMIEDQIADGDYVIIHRQETATKGQIVVAITDENEATLKRWFPERNRIRLEPANKTMAPIYVKNARVLGVVVGVVRKVA
ncbi:MAG: transcriptional repressor LexA [Patescibacteria group bacterium]|nr:transcriptional repressor LexA [Patescibacteria group bacterium]